MKKVQSPYERWMEIQERDRQNPGKFFGVYEDSEKSTLSNATKDRSILEKRKRIHEYRKKNTASKIQIGGDHYMDMLIQPTYFITKNGIGFIEGCIIKYACRHRQKGGKQDLEKIKHYVDLLIEYEYTEVDNEAEVYEDKDPFIRDIHDNIRTSWVPE